MTWAKNCFWLFFQDPYRKNKGFSEKVWYYKNVRHKILYKMHIVLFLKKKNFPEKKSKKHWKNHFFENFSTPNCQIDMNFFLKESLHLRAQSPRMNFSFKINSQREREPQRSKNVFFCGFFALAPRAFLHGHIATYTSALSWKNTHLGEI